MSGMGCENAVFAERRISVLHDFVFLFIYIGKTRHRRCAAENNNKYTKHCGTSAVTRRPVVSIKNTSSEEFFTELCPDLKEARLYERYGSRKYEFCRATD